MWNAPVASCGCTRIRRPHRSIPMTIIEQVAAAMQDLLTTLAQALAVQRVLAAERLAIPILEQFAGVFIEDSTIIVLPDALRDLWHGCGNATEQGDAAVKLTLRLDLLTGQLAGLSLHDGRVHDSRAAHPVTSLPKESLYLADLGFFRLERLHQIDAQGGFFLSRLQAHTTVFDASGTRWDDLAALLATQAASVDLSVTLGV